MGLLRRALGVLFFLGVLASIGLADAGIEDSNIAFSPYNWFRSGADYAQTDNPGAYLKVGFTGTEIAVKIDVSPLMAAKVPQGHYPVVRYSVDGKPPVTLQLKPAMASIPCAVGLSSGNHSLFLQYVAGYVFLDFWSPVNVLRVGGFALSSGASLSRLPVHSLNALFLGDSITNGDDDVATFTGGITNEVDTQDATIGYPSLVSSGIGAEYGVVAYGGASWDGTAADGHTPGLMHSFDHLDSLHLRKLFPVPDDIFINMGENSPPSRDDVPKLLTALRAESKTLTNIWVIVPFSGRSRDSLSAGVAAYQKSTPTDIHVHIIDLGNNPFLTDAGPTMLSVDGQHPLAILHAQLAAQLVAARAKALER